MARIERLKARTTQADFVRLCEIFSPSDLSATLPKIGTPTLVIHVPGQGLTSQEECARTAALLPNGRLVVVGGSTFYGDADEVVSAVQNLVAESCPPPALAYTDGRSLSQRELQVLRLLADGKSNQQIAGELVISVNTANRHVSNVYAKTGAANRAEAVSYAYRHGLAD
jgi:DNA-binding NarL/FixJ family response regulator